MTIFISAPIMSQSIADSSLADQKTVLDVVRNLEKMLESHVMGVSGKRMMKDTSARSKSIITAITPRKNR